MGLLRIRESGRVLTEITYRTENKTNRKVPRKGSLSEAWLNDNGIDAVFEGSVPTLTSAYQTVEPDGYEQKSGKWHTKWKIGPNFTEYTDDKGKKVTATEQTNTWKAQIDANAAAQHRATRNAKLAETDFYALSDNTLTDAMKIYRQLLRDMPAQKSWPHITNSEWPTKP